MIRAVTYALAAVLTMQAATAVAGPLWQCDRPVLAHSIVEDDHLDLGYGVVQYRSYGSLAGTSFKKIHLVHCASGTALETTTRWQTYDPTAGRPNGVPWDESLDYDVRANVDKILRQARWSPKPYSLEQVAALVQDTGALTILSTIDEEVCACAVQYPEKRNGKKAFSE